MALGALPPDLSPAPGDHVPGGEGGVFGGVPLFGQVGVEGGQVVVPRAHLPAGAVGAAGPGGPGFHDGAPLMALGALPPHPAAAAPQDLVRGEAAVFGGVPLPGHVGEAGGQVVEPRPGLLPGAVGAAALPAGAGVHGGFPAVALLAPPPDFPAAAVGDPRRGEIAVGLGVPLVQQILPLKADTIVRQRFSHGLPPSFPGHSPLGDTTKF